MGVWINLLDCGWRAEAWTVQKDWAYGWRRLEAQVSRACAILEKQHPLGCKTIGAFGAGDDEHLHWSLGALEYRQDGDEVENAKACRAAKPYYQCSI